MRIGKLRDRIEIQERTLTRDSFGDAQQEWETVATVWGMVEPLTGSEPWQADQSRPGVGLKVTIRYYAGLTPKHRLKLGDRVINIEGAITTDNRRREHVLQGREEV